MCSDSEAGSYLRLIDFVYPSTLGLKVTKQKKKFEVTVATSCSTIDDRCESCDFSSVALVVTVA